MRFIGNKEKLLDQIYQVVSSTNTNGGTFCDFFSGTSNVGRYFKELLKEIKTSSEGLFSSPFDLVRNYLNTLKGIRGFIYKNYTMEGTAGKEFIRKYFTPENGKKIDAIRT